MNNARRHAPKIDATQTAIADALWRAGCTVQSLAAVGKGCPDLLVGRAGVNHLLEVKVPRQRLNAVQVVWHESWHGTVHVVSTPEEALRAVGLAP